MHSLDKSTRHVWTQVEAIFDALDDHVLVVTDPAERYDDNQIEQVGNRK